MTTSSYYTPAYCPGCEQTTVPHATVGEQCPGTMQKRARNEFLGRLALESVHNRGRCEYLGRIVGPTAAVELVDAAKQVLAERERQNRSY